MQSSIKSPEIAGRGRLHLLRSARTRSGIDAAPPTPFTLITNDFAGVVCWLNAKLAQRYVCPFSCLRGKVGMGGTGMASFIFRGGIFAMPVSQIAGSSPGIARSRRVFMVYGFLDGGFIPAPRLHTSPAWHWRFSPPAASPALRSAHRPPSPAPRRTGSRTG